MTPPCRLCVCGHNFSVHRRGPCGMTHWGCDCPEFRELPLKRKLTPGGWLPAVERLER